MAKTRPFSRYIGGPLSNFTEQVGNLYFGNDNTLFEVGGLKWWNGPDEDNGYVIAFEDAQGSHTGADGEPAFLGFKRSSQKTEASFLLLTRKVTGQTFTTGAEAKAYLNANGMWTSYGLETIEPTATPQPTATEVAPTATPQPTTTEVAPTATPEPTLEPTATPEPTLEPTATEVAPTATPEPTATEVAPTATPQPTATEVAPTATPEPTATATPASGFTVTIDEVGSDVVMTATGSLNIDGLTLVESNVGPFSGAGFGVSTATYVLGTTPINYDSYTGFDTYPTSFGSYGGLPPESSTGDIFGVIMQGAPPYMLIVPVGYQSGDQISTSQTFENKTLSSLGLTSGTYTYTWGTGANAETFNVVIGSGAGNGGGGTPTTIDETLYWSYGNPFNISLTYNAATTGGNGVGMVNGFYLNKLSSDIDGNLVGDQSSFLMNLPAGTLISYSNTVNPSVYNGIYEVVSVSDMTNTVLVNVTFVSTTYQFGSLQNGIAEFHFYSPNNSGSGEWYFYSSDEGPVNATAPIQDGNAIFLIRDNQNGTLNETFNPNKVGGANEIYFNLSDSNGTDYTTQFTNLQTNGGSITITQGANSVTYTSTTPGVFFVEGQAGFFIIQAGQATQTVTSASPFVYGDPISISFS